MHKERDIEHLPWLGEKWETHEMNILEGNDGIILWYLKRKFKDF